MKHHFPVPVKIIVEHRRSSRIALRSRQIIIRLPAGMTPLQKQKTTDDLLSWAALTIEQKQLYQQSTIERFAHGNMVKLMGEEYLIEHHFSPGTRASLHLSHQGILRMHLPGVLEQQKSARIEFSKKLLAEGLGKLFLPRVQARVLELNRQHFNATLTKISMRYTNSRWGSCSSSGSINLSTRLLLTPAEVRDYVIIHELAHRFEMNHSQRFWALVGHAMPEYREHMTWLKLNGAAMDF